MKKACILFPVTAALFLFSPASVCTSNESSSPEGIHVEGELFVDSAGRQVILRGVNAGGRSKLPPFYPFEPEPDFESALARYVDSIQSLGFNVVRLLVIYEAAEPVRGGYNEEYLVVFDRMVQAFADRGILIIIDSHQDLFSRRLCGDGFPDWALDEKYRDRPQHADCKLWSLKYFTYPVASSLDRLYSNEDGIVDSYAAFFGMLAERYKGVPEVIGFEPMNEPFPGLRGFTDYSGWYEELFSLYEAVAKEIHEADERYLIFADLSPLENITGALNASRQRPEIKNLVMAPHYYDLGTFGKSFSKGGDQWMMRGALKKHLELSSAWNAPMLVTEYGISPLTKNAPVYINKLYSVFDELHLSGTFWEASMSETIWNMENTSLFDPDGTLRPAAMSLDRPYPRAVAGIIERFKFDSDTGGFELTWTENMEIPSPTEIHLPALIYGNAPEVHLEPEGEYSFDPDSRVLSVFSLNRNISRQAIITP